jgi:hypothetical protein
MSQSLKVNLPNELYLHIKMRADEARRSVEEEAVEMLVATGPAADSSLANVRQSVASLELLDNADDERAARGRLAAELATEIETLHLKQQREGLTDAEQTRCAELVRAYERSMLVRAHAAALLKKRGVEVDGLVVQPCRR